MAGIDAVIAQWVAERTQADVLQCLDACDVFGGPGAHSCLSIE